MVEADTYCLVGAAFSSIVCLACFGSYWFFEERPGWEFAADTSVFIILATSMGAVAWSKNWMSRPSYNTGEFLAANQAVSLANAKNAACSMASIMIFIVYVHLGAVVRLRVTDVCTVL